MLVCRFEYAMRIRAYDIGFGRGLYVRESIANAGMPDSFGIVQLSGKPGEKRKHCKASVKELEARRGKVLSFS